MPYMTSGVRNPGDMYIHQIAHYRHYQMTATHRYQIFREKLKSENCLRRVDTLGSFDFYTTIVSLDALDKAKLESFSSSFPDYAATLLDVDKPITPAQYSAVCEILPLLVHETTHYLDTTSTIWGLKHLQLMNSAYLCEDSRGGSESDFFQAKQFGDHIRGLRLPNYYTVVNPKGENKRPWRHDRTVGKLFDMQGRISERPVIFGRFSNANGVLLARSPVSMVSLLEASAMAHEIKTQAVFLPRTPNDFQLVEQALFSKRSLDYLYNPEITEYSVCVHTVANQQQCKDVLQAFNVCAVLIRIALNFPEISFRKVLECCDFAKALRVPAASDYEHAFRMGVTLRDRGTIFFLLSSLLPPMAYDSSRSLSEGVDFALTKMGTSVQDVQSQSIAEAESIRMSIGRSKLRPIDLIATVTCLLSSDQGELETGALVG